MNEAIESNEVTIPPLITESGRDLSKPIQTTVHFRNERLLEHLLSLGLNVYPVFENGGPELGLIRYMKVTAGDYF